jgi:hypothetical protein
MSWQDWWITLLVVFALFDRWDIYQLTRRIEELEKKLKEANRG